MQWTLIGSLAGRPGVDGKDAPPVDIARVVAEVAALVPVPKDGAPGKDTDPAAVAAMVAKAVAELPRPKVDEADVQTAIRLAVESAVAEIKAMVPRDGKDADPELVRAEVARAFAEMPKPRDGTDGRSVDPDEVVRAVDAAVAKAMASVPLPKDGRDGQSVHPDSVALMVRTEVEKAVSAMPRPQDGRDGRDGHDGNPGRDAFQIDVLPAIDIEKSYPRGTFAWHRNGFWHARANTDGMQGWFCQIKGVAEEKEELQADGRTIVKTITYSDGSTLVTERKSAVQIYRGVFVEGTAYSIGDQVTWGGSQWHCDKDTTGKPGDNNDSWTLSVKKGRDGRDGTHGKDGEKGAPGKNGRDLTQLAP